MLNPYLYGGLSRKSIRQKSFEEFRKAELENRKHDKAVNKEGDLLDYETLELRVHPPNINVEIGDADTKIVLDSANRPGTLIQVVQCLTELGLSFKKAFITTDGGWFVDEFVVHENDGPVSDAKKVEAIKKVLNVDFEQDEANLCAPGIQPGPCTVLELSVHDDRKPLKEEDNWRMLHTELVKTLGEGSHAERDFVKHAALIHHERRLHRLMLSDDKTRYESEDKKSDRNSITTATLPGTELLSDAHKHNSDIPIDPDKPIVKVTYAPERKYWFVSILCIDRNKLLFDLVCTFVDLDFDIYHATLDAERAADVVKSTIEFYVRPRLGGPEYDGVKGRLLGEMLRASILRRLPTGLKLQVRTYPDTDRKLSLINLTHELTKSELTITRASVKPSKTSAGCAQHTFYVSDGCGEDPGADAVKDACSRAGGHLSASSSQGDLCPSGMDKQSKSFSFSLMERSWRKEWGMGSGSTTSRTIDSG